MKGVENKENQKKYPLLPYILAMFVVVVALVLVSYFAQQRSNSEQMSQYSEQHTSQFEQYDERLNDLETRVTALENTNK